MYIENINKYVENLKEKKNILRAQKSGCVIARFGIENEEIKTFVENGTLETKNTVKRDEEGNLDVVVTRADLSKNKVYDIFGHTNTYIIPLRTFLKKYENANNLTFEESFFKPKGGIQEFVQIDEDISLTTSWGEIQNLKSGSFLNVSNKDDIYGIAFEEFMDTYSFVDQKDLEKITFPENSKISKNCFVK